MKLHSILFHLASVLVGTVLTSHSFAADDATETKTGVHDLSHWKLTLPVSAKQTYSGSPLEVPAAELSQGFSNSYFQIDDHGALVFWCPVIGTPTDNTKYARSELREMIEPGDVRTNWSMPGTHTMQARCTVLQVPSNPKVVIGQIHSHSGKQKPLVKLQYFKGRLEALVKKSPIDGKDLKLKFPNCPLNKEIAWTINLHDGVLAITVNGSTQSVNVVKADPEWAKQTFYFKAGVYPQDNEGDETEGARVSFAHLTATHQTP